jgi:queuine tRNA-ribosyltransferase
MKCEVILTRSGAPAMRDRASGEVMHPGTGPGVEPQALYVVPSRLDARLRGTGVGDVSDDLVLLDVGLGAASNAIAAWRVSEALRDAHHARRLQIVSFDDDLSALELALRPEHAESFALTTTGGDAHGAATELLASGLHETSRTTWRLSLGDFPVQLAREPSSSADIVFWDFYSSKTHPHLWSLATLRELRRVCRSGATLHTYSTATSFRAGLLLAGFAVGVGGGTGDRAETTLAAVDVADLERPLDARWLARLERSSAALPADVGDDAGARGAALAQIRACVQFASPLVPASAPLK